MRKMLGIVVLLLCSLLPTKSFALSSMECSISWFRFFDTQELTISNMEQGRELVCSMSARLLPSVSSREMQKAYQYALGAIRKSDVPTDVKRKMGFVVAELALGQSLADEWSDLDEDKIPGSLILGGVEILMGALIHVIPGCGWLGKLIIADGIRRGFNGLEEVNDSNITEKYSFHEDAKK